MGKKYIYIVLFISTGIYAIADYYCICNFTFTLLFTIFLIFNLVNSVICFAKSPFLLGLRMSGKKGDFYVLF